MFDEVQNGEHNTYREGALTLHSEQTSHTCLPVLLLGLGQQVGELLVGGEGLLQLSVDVLLPARDLLQGLGDLGLQLVQLHPGHQQTLLDTVPARSGYGL